MHEVGIMQSAAATAEQQARAQGATRIHRLTLRIGQLSGVVPEALQFAFEAVTLGTMAEGAELEIETVPAAYWCAPCAAEFNGENFLAECPRCHQLARELRRGREMELCSMEVS